MNPEISCPDGFEELDLPFDIASDREIFGNPSNPKSLYIKLFGNKGTQQIYGYVKFGDHAEGPPGHVHGGAIAYVLDETLGALGWYVDLPVVVEKLEIKYRNLAPLNELLIIEAVIDDRKGSKISVKGSLKYESGLTLSEGLGIFHILSEDQLRMFEGKTNRSFPDRFRKNLSTT